MSLILQWLGLHASQLSNQPDQQHQWKSKNDSDPSRPAVAGMPSPARYAGAALQWSGSAADSCAGWPSRRYRTRRLNTGMVPTSNPMDYIGEHAHQRDVGNAAHPGRQRNDQGENAGQHISQPWDKSDDAVKAKANPRAGDDEGFIQQNFQPAQALVAQQLPPPIQRSLLPGRGARQFLAAHRVAHWLPLPALQATRCVLGTHSLRCYNQSCGWRL
jgi:hypothetical protein